jgi:hypothetical protein
MGLNSGGKRYRGYRDLAFQSRERYAKHERDSTDADAPDDGVSGGNCGIQQYCRSRYGSRSRPNWSYSSCRSPDAVNTARSNELSLTETTSRS